MNSSIYPEQLCYSIIRGLRSQKCETGLAHLGEIGTICEDFDEHCLMTEIQHDTSIFYDNVSGKPLDPKLVRIARAEEIDGANKHNVWTKVSVNECWDQTGKGPIGTRWVDINKGMNLTRT